MAEYTAKFNELAHFAKSTVLRDMFTKKKYMQGLKQSSARCVSSGNQDLKSFTDVRSI